MSEINIEIVTPAGIIYSSAIESCTAPGKEGKFQILNGHAALLANLHIGEIKVETSGETKFLSNAGGFLEVQDNKISIVVESAEIAENIDIERAKSAETRAIKRLEGREDIDIDRAKLALARALNRLKISSQH